MSHFGEVRDEVAEDDLSDDGWVTELPDEYPKVSSTVKNTEPVLLQQCTVRRMRTIPLNYDGINQRLKKL